MSKSEERKNDLIAELAEKVSFYEKQIKANDKTVHELHGMFFSIGAPLNDNVLQFNKAQMTWAFEVWSKIDEIKRTIEA